MANPVREKKYYREWVIFNCKSLRVLDYQRVHEKVSLRLLQFLHFIQRLSLHLGEETSKNPIHDPG